LQEETAAFVAVPRDVESTTVDVGEGVRVEVMVGAAKAVWVRENAKVDTASVRIASGLTVGVNSAALGPQAERSSPKTSKALNITSLRVVIRYYFSFIWQALFYLNSLYKR
jgi:hypothetical protein